MNDKPHITLSRLRELHQQARAYSTNFGGDTRGLFRACVYDELRLRTIAEQVAMIARQAQRIDELEGHLDDCLMRISSHIDNTEFTEQLYEAEMNKVATLQATKTAQDAELVAAQRYVLDLEREVSRLRALAWQPAHDEDRTVDFPVSEGHVFLLRYPGEGEEYIVLPSGYAICRKVTEAASE